MQSSITNVIVSYWRYALAAVIVVSIGWYYFGAHGNTLGATLTISQGDFKEQVNVSGTVSAAMNVDLGFAANGRIAGITAQVGQHVIAGTVLAHIENGDVAAQLAQAKANLASLVSGTRPEELAVASAAVVNAQATLVDAVRSAYTVSDDAVHNKVDTLFNTVDAQATNPPADLKLTFTTVDALRLAAEHDRAATNSVLAGLAALIPTLSSANAASVAKVAQQALAQISVLLADTNAALNQAVPNQTTTSATLSAYASTLASARSSVNAAATTLTTAMTALDSAQSNLTLKQAGATSDAILAEQAAVASAEAALAKTYVTAPFDGVVTRMDAKVGEIVSPSTSEISMQSDGIFQIETYVPEVSVAGVAVGNGATVTLDAYGPGVTFPAKVILVDPAETVKDGVPTYKTTLAFLNTDPRIRSGMTANVTIETGVLHNAVVVPTGAIGTTAAGPYVTVVINGAARSRAVTTAVSPSLGQTQIIQGLSAGDVILLTPLPAP